jgi:phosphoribosylamine--glycine ligase
MNTLTILVVGGGGREHALWWALAKSPRTGTLICAPGNAGTAALAENIRIRVSDIDGLVALARDRAVDLVIVGPEEPLSLGLADRLEAEGIPVFGPSQAAAQIETSKRWAKGIMAEAGVPTARYVAVNDLADGMIALGRFTFPVVVKADGLAAGKGVVIVNSYEEGVMALTALLEERSLGSAAATVLIEEHLAGPEVSILAVTDGEAIRILAPSCDHKRAFDHDLGPNTGGMGAYAPTSLVGDALMYEIEQTILRPTIEAMRAWGAPMRGVLYAGLMLTAEGPKVLEFNARFGDPEAQVVLPLLETDLAELLLAAATGTLGEQPPITTRSGAAVGVVMASAGYPGPYRTGLPITGIPEAEHVALVFQAGTAPGADGGVVTAGGRVLTVVGHGATIAEAQLLAYAGCEAIQFDGAFYRTDIGRKETQSALW